MIICGTHDPPPFFSLPACQDSLLDVIVSLGAPDDKIILTGSAFGNRFVLSDPDRTTPGAAALGPPETITYQQVRGETIWQLWQRKRKETLYIKIG